MVLGRRLPGRVGRRRISLEEGRPPGRPSSRFASTRGRQGTDQFPRPRARRRAARSAWCRPAARARRWRRGEGIGSVGPGSVGSGARRSPAIGPAGSTGALGAGWGLAAARRPHDRWPGEEPPGPAGRHAPLGPLDPPGRHDPPGSPGRYEPPGRGPAWWPRRRSATWPPRRRLRPHGLRFRPNGAWRRRWRRRHRPEAPRRRRGRRPGAPVAAATAARPAAGGWHAGPARGDRRWRSRPGPGPAALGWARPPGRRPGPADRRVGRLAGGGEGPAPGRPRRR